MSVIQRISLFGGLLGTLIVVQAQPLPEATPPLHIPPPLPALPYVPFTELSIPALDEANNRLGDAQHLSRQEGVQGRVLWIDATANLGRLNTPEKITALVSQIEDVGFTTIVLDIKPIVGHTLYPSKLAPRLTEWRGVLFPETVDPVALMVTAAHAAGLELVVNMNVFSEGHRLVGKGPGFARPDWQSIFYEPQLLLVSPEGKPIPLVARAGTALPPTGAIGIYTAWPEVPLSPTTVLAIVNERRRVFVLLDGKTAAAAMPPIPRGGAVLVAGEGAGAFLQQVAVPGTLLTLETGATYIRSGSSENGGVPLWVNPHNLEVQERMLAMVDEVLTNYAVDGIIFDDRLRYAGINADFSEATRRAFEAYIGRPITWPADVFRYDLAFPTMSRRLLAGPYFDTWVLWRALTIRNWLARAVSRAKTIRAGIRVSLYVGSWYGEYPAYGINWGATDLQAGFRFLSEDYRRTGVAGLVDWISTGCYYPMPTVGDATMLGQAPGHTIEAAAQLSNRCINSETWLYAGIALDKFTGNPEALARALQAAAAASQGVMVFDLSHDIDTFWPVFARAFDRPARPPHSRPELRATVRVRKATRRAAGEIDPPVIIQQGAVGTGF